MCQASFLAVRSGQGRAGQALHHYQFKVVQIDHPMKEAHDELNAVGPEAHGALGGS